jgi:hypothetical protein
MGKEFPVIAADHRLLERGLVESAAGLQPDEYRSSEPEVGFEPKTREKRRLSPFAPVKRAHSIHVQAPH